MKLTKAFWAVSLAVLMVGFALAQEPSQAGATPQPPAHQDAPAPEPNPELKPLLEEILNLLNSDKFQDALPKTDELLQQARAKGDKVGEAYALRFRAIALQELRRDTPDQLPEVASVWASALALWREIGDEAYQVEALLGQAYCLWRVSPDRSETLVKEALGLARGEAKRPLALAQALHNAGADWYGVGQVAVAEQLLQRALAIQEKLAPNSLEVASTLHNLGIVAYSRGDLARAEQYYQQALAIYEKLAPNSLQVANTLGNLGNVAANRGDLAAAERYYQQALAIFEKLAPNSLEVASTLHNLGSVARNRGDLAAAERYLQQALAIQEKLAPNSLEVASTLHNLGSVARNRGDLAAAEQLYQRALAIEEKLAPNSLEVATTLQNLANLARQQKNYPQAQRYLARALEIYETQRATIQDPETKTAFAETYFDAYTLQAQLALDQQQPQQAALALERSRARTLAELMHARTLPIPANAPKALRDLLAQYEQLQRDFLLLARQQRQANANDADTVQRLQAQSRQLADRQRQLDRQLRQQFPQYADLLNPQPPDLKQLQAALDATTVLLCPEGALNQLPWGALIVAVDKQGRPTYWVERVALGITPSAGVYLQAKAVRPALRGVAIAAVSQYQQQVAQGSAVEQLVRRSGGALGDLPAVKQEVAQLRRLLGKQGVAAVLEAAATPERARQMAQGARVVHFACHARADDVDPLGSGLLLSPAGSDAGLLTAAEVG
jgi:tetratricopeptide (TPR) repeat protein